MTLLQIIGIILLVMIIGLAIKIVTRVVPQEERLVIYRLGRFHRVGGPGPVVVIPSLDEVKRIYRVRDQPLEVTVGGLFPYGVPTEMTLNLWCSFDLVQAAGGDHDKLASLVQLSDSERRHQVKIKVQEALIHRIADLEERRPLPPSATLRERVIALAPGSPRYEELLEEVKGELQQTLPSVGVVLNTTQSITLTKRDISGEIIQALQRSHSRELDSEWLTNYADTLRRQFPGMSNAVLAQILSSIEGVDTGRLQRLLLEQEAGVEAEVEYEVDKHGEGPKVVAKPKGEIQDSAAEREHAPLETERKARQRSSRPLTQSDLAVLKRVPRGDDNRRLSA